ncbi:unnamed protein product [Closterium sp. NIES-65]|nr:unnamed protein product [Closterium sp. NIES-65]
MDSCRAARPSSTVTSADLSAPLLHPAPVQPCPPVAAASSEADALESSPSAPFVPLSRDSRPWRDRSWRIAFLFLAILTLLRALRLLIPALRASPGPSAALVTLSYARIGVAVVAAAPLVWGVLLYVRRHNSLAIILPAHFALVALLFFVGAFLILHLPQLFFSDSLVLSTSAGPIATSAAGAATSSHVLAAMSTLAAAARAAARAMLMDGVSSVVDATAATLTRSVTARTSSTWLLTPSRTASPPLSDSLALLFSSFLSLNNSAPLTSPLGIPSVLPSPFLTSPFPPTSVLASPFPSSPLVSSSMSPPLLSLDSNHFIVHFACLFALLSLAMLLLLSRPLKRLSLSLLRRTAAILLSHSQSILYFVLLLLLLQVLVTAPLAAVVRKVAVLCAMVAGEGKIPAVCAAWLLPLLTQLANPPLLLLFLLLGLWAVVVFSMLIAFLAAALVGHGVSAEEGDHRDEIRRGKHSGEGAAGDGAAAAYPAIAAVAAVPTRSVWSAVHASHVPSAIGITKRPQFSHLPLLGHALRLVLTRSLGTAAAVAMLLIVLYILFTALNTWLAVYVFASLEVPGLLTGSAAALLTVAQLLLLHVLTWFVLPVAGITGKGVWASLAIALRLLPAHLLPSLALFIFTRMLILGLAITTETLLWLLVLWLTPSPLSASHAWVVGASFTRLFLSSILSTALSTLTLSLLASVPALYVYLALGERLDARTGVVLGKQGDTSG